MERQSNQSVQALDAEKKQIDLQKTAIDNQKDDVKRHADFVKKDLDKQAAACKRVVEHNAENAKEQIDEHFRRAQ